MGRSVPAREVLVVGGGPAGLEAARVLAERGATVRLVERADRLGGALPLVAALPGRQRFADLAAWLTGECARLGADVELGRAVTADDLRAATAAGEFVVVATGSRRRPPEFTVGPDACLLTAADLLAGGPADVPEGPVVVHDPVGGAAGAGVAELLAAAGRDVTVVTPDRVVGSRLGGDLAPANGRLLRAGVRRETASLLRAVDGTTARLENRWTGAVRAIACSVLVDCGPSLADESLAPADGEAVVTVGDVVAPRTVLEAVLEGRRAARALLSAHPSRG